MPTWSLLFFISFYIHFLLFPLPRLLEINFFYGFSNKEEELKNNSHLTFLLLHTSFTTSFTTSFSLFFILIVRDVHIHINKIEINDHCHFLIPYSSCCSYNIYNVRICLRSYTTVQHISIVLHFLFSPLLFSLLAFLSFLPDTTFW